MHIWCQYHRYFAILLHFLFEALSANCMSISFGHVLCTCNYADKVLSYGQILVLH